MNSESCLKSSVLESSQCDTTTPQKPEQCNSMIGQRFGFQAEIETQAGVIFPGIRARSDSGD